jgi:hypothetical protein
MLLVTLALVGSKAFHRAEHLYVKSYRESTVNALYIGMLLLVMLHCDHFNCLPDLLTAETN